MRQVIHALLTRPPLSQSSVRKLPIASFDLHVLGTPPAFILSQDQTLMLMFVPGPNLAWLISKPFYCCFRFCSECSHSWPKPLSHFIRIFRVLHTVQFSRFFAVFRDSQINISQLFSLVNNFFQKFFELPMLSQRTLSVRFVCPCLSRTRHILPPAPTKVNTFL